MHNVVRIMSTISLLVGVSLVGISLGTREAPESAASAQEDRVQGYRPTVARIIDEALRTPRGYENLRELTTVAPKSLSGSPAAAAAVEWAHQVFQKSGFDKVWLEPLMVPHWERGDVGQVKIVEPASHMEELPMLALGGSVGTPPQVLTAEIVEIRSFEELVERKEEVREDRLLQHSPRCHDPKHLRCLFHWRQVSNSRCGEGCACRSDWEFGTKRHHSTRRCAAYRRLPLLGRDAADPPCRHQFRRR